MRKWRELFFILLVITMLLCGCTKNDTTDGRTNYITLDNLPCFSRTETGSFTIDLEKKGTQAVCSISSYICDLGIFSFDKEACLLVFEDFSTGTISPMCVQPNCTHDSEICSAWFPFEESGIEYPYFDGTYFV